MKRKFLKNQIVTVISKTKGTKEINGKIGIILGCMSYRKTFNYTVFVDGICWQVSEKELISNGEFYIGPKDNKPKYIKVIVNEKGEGFIK
jgi:hypothetical protein